MEIPLRLGPLRAEGYTIHRSSVRWLCQPGQSCRAHQVIAYFNLSLEASGARPGTAPFGEERELQVACATRTAGRIHFDSEAEPGGYLSIFEFNRWDSDTVLAHLEPDDSSAAPEAATLRLLFLAGRRMTPLVDVHTGLLPGWHGCSRGWWGENGQSPLTLLSLGICDVTGVVTGEHNAFVELFRGESQPTHVVFVPDQPVTPSAPVLLDQLERTPADFRAISADLHAALSKPATPPTPNDWMFAGTLLTMMQRCPIRETHDLLSVNGLTRSKPANVLLISLQAEPATLLRHKTLGYRLHLMRHHYEAAGPAVHGWLGQAFEQVTRTTGDIKTDYEAFFAAVKKSTGAHIAILNRMSTSGDETIESYAPFDAPMSNTLASIAAKEQNLMLHELAAAHPNVSIVDVDALAAEIGGREHLPDGVHQSRGMQEVLRGEIVHLLRSLRPAT